MNPDNAADQVSAGLAVLLTQSVVSKQREQFPEESADSHGHGAAVRTGLKRARTNSNMPPDKPGRWIC